MNIFLSGYFYNNLGDDLFYHIVTNRYPNHQFHAMIHSDYAHTYQGLNNVTVYPQTKTLRAVDKLFCKVSPKWSLYARKARKMDASLLIGGSMFMELHDDGSDIDRLAQMPQNYKKLFVMGINFGPHKTEAYQKACMDYFATADDVCFRDKTSYDHFNQLPQTRLGSDIVFGIEKLCPKAEAKENTCLISVMDLGRKPSIAAYKEDYLQFLKKQILSQQAQGRRVVLVSFSQAEGDEAAISQLLEYLPDQSKEAVETLCYDGTNWKAVCEKISAAACLIATRFHSMVLGLSYGVPTIAISYSNKTFQVLQDLGAAHKAILPEQLKDLEDAQISPITDICTDCLKESAEAHFEKLDQFLETF